jgi:hypothetical protein
MLRSLQILPLVDKYAEIHAALPCSCCDPPPCGRLATVALSADVVTWQRLGSSRRRLRTSRITSIFATVLSNLPWFFIGHAANHFVVVVVTDLDGQLGGGLLAY